MFGCFHREKEYGFHSAVSCYLVFLPQRGKGLAQRRKVLLANVLDRQHFLCFILAYVFSVR
jgi:hypothetical protein